MKYAITYKQEGVEKPNFEFSSPSEASKAFFMRHVGNTSQLDMCIVDKNGKVWCWGMDDPYQYEKNRGKQNTALFAEFFLHDGLVAIR